MIRRLTPVLLVALAACSGDATASKAVGATVEAPTTTVAPPPEVALTVTSAEVVGPAAPAAPLVDPVLGEVVGLVREFLDVTSLHPLTGRPGPGLSHLLLDGAATQAAREDRAVVFDEGQPPAAVTATEASVALRALAGNDGAVRLVVADFVWDVAAAMRVRRTGELSIVPTASGWQIATYDLSVERP